MPPKKINVKMNQTRSFTKQDQINKIKITMSDSEDNSHNSEKVEEKVDMEEESKNAADKSEEEKFDDEKSDSEEGEETPTKKRRGRPKGKKQSVSEEDEEPPKKKQRGRPKSNKQSSEKEEVEEEVEVEVEAEADMEVDMEEESKNASDKSEEEKSDDEKSESEEEYDPKRKTPKKKGRQNNRAASDSEEEYDPKRKVPKKKDRKSNRAASDSEEDYDPKRKTPKKKGRQNNRAASESEDQDEKKKSRVNDSDSESEVEAKEVRKYKKAKQQSDEEDEYTGRSSGFSSEDDCIGKRTLIGPPRRGRPPTRGSRARGRARGRGRVALGRGRPRNVIHSDDEEDDLDSLGPRSLICQLCKLFYRKNWLSGTGGGITIKEDVDIYVAPSGVQKERMKPKDMFKLDTEGEVQESPADNKLKLSQCTPLFMLAYDLRDAGAVIHSHSKHAVLASLITKGNEFTITHVEMLKGIRNGETGKFLRYDDTLVVPIIENTPHEDDLADSMEQAIKDYPECQAVLVRRHGIYVWGDTWQAAKTMSECFDYLFEVAVDMHKLQLDYTSKPEEHKKAISNGK